jgi:chromosome segregation ATPase
VYKWYTFKQGLISEGRQVCVQAINKDTMEQLQSALAAEKSARADLTARLTAAAAANREARERRVEVEASLKTLEAEMRAQRETDETYRKWSDTPLPDGVADRLRKQATPRSDTRTVRDDQD